MKYVHVFLFLTFVVSQGCVTIFSEFQSAETLGKGNYEVTPSASIVAYYDEYESERAQNSIGVQYGYGITDKLDLKTRLEIPWVSDEIAPFGDIFVFGFGPKFGIVEKRFSIYTPVGFAFGNEIETSETIEFHPTALYSIPVSEHFEINTSGKFILPITTDNDPFYAINIGLGIWNDNIGIRPEIGLLKSTQTMDGNYVHFGLGLSLRSSK